MLVSQNGIYFAHSIFESWMMENLCESFQRVVGILLSNDGANHQRHKWKYILKCKKKKEDGCTKPLYGKKAKCLIRIVPDEKKAKTLEIDKKCIKKL